ncbi:hypothetical protein BN2475_490059 [Paraburkholderia ribeironis]|uniref:Uncharacterized protein n=1 Tax=Paraburkholderia ribeironis TaxID=1247936 RepID=A0A1N7SBW0_9BURK|nr:hypothetical protein [Paraburkholderia ribeironis]SIT44821.1 hypothetical protein BN2475_490059 [Paraburkholderia ribeironis]
MNIAMHLPSASQAVCVDDTCNDPAHGHLHREMLDALAEFSYRERWPLNQCAAVARRIEAATRAELEGLVSSGIVEWLKSTSNFGQQLPQGDKALLNISPVDSPLDPVRVLHQSLRSLEAQLVTTPPLVTGIQGVRIMGLVAMMSPKTTPGLFPFQSTLSIDE